MFHSLTGHVTRHGIWITRIVALVTQIANGCECSDYQREDGNEEDRKNKLEKPVHFHFSIINLLPESTT